jgi:ribose transport system substrate-binding protein
MSRLFLSVILSPVLLVVLGLSYALAAPEPVQAQTSPATSKTAQPANKAVAKAAEPGDEYPRPAKPAKAYTIGVVVPMLSNPFFIGQAYGYIDEGEKLGARVILHEAGGYQYLEKQITQMEDLIASKVDAIDLVAINGSGTVPLVERAVAAGIPVVNCNVMTDSDQVVSRIRSDDFMVGRMQAEFMARALHGKGNVVMLRGPAGTSWANLRGEGFRKRMAEVAPAVKILGEQYSQNTPADGLRLMEDFMQTYPQIDGVYNGSDMLGIGSAQAIRAAGKAGRIVVTATDLQADAEKFMREGVLTASVLQQSVTIGRWCIRASINYLEKRPVPKQLWTPIMLVSKENLSQADFRGVRAPEGWKPPVR